MLYVLPSASWIQQFLILCQSKANAGDSRSVIGIKGEVKALSFDHKPTSEGRCPAHVVLPRVLMGSTVERTRIHGAGGFIEFGRVNGACPACVHGCGCLTDDPYQATSHYREHWGILSSRKITP